MYIKPVTSTKAGMQMSSIEFVLGINQVVKGFDCAIPQMSVGERSRIRISAEYAYGKAGLFPIVPPDAELVFDLTLLGFRPRAEWIKPLIQEPGLSEKPYFSANDNENNSMTKTFTSRAGTARSVFADVSSLDGYE